MVRPGLAAAGGGVAGAGTRSGLAGLVRPRRGALVTAGLARRVESGWFSELGSFSAGGFWLLFAAEVSLAAARGITARMGEVGRRGSGKAADWGRVWGVTVGKNDLMGG